MKVGIYLSGLGGTFTEESAEKYAYRFAQQYSFDQPAATIDCKIQIDKFVYGPDAMACDRITITEDDGDKSRVLMKFYEFKYTGILTRSFNSKNPLLKFFLLFITVIAKLPGIISAFVIARKSVKYSPRFKFQTFYLFFIFLVVSFGILLLIPAAFIMLLEITNQEDWLRDVLAVIHIDFTIIEKIAKGITNLTAILVLIAPGYNDALILLACEFVSASEYLDQGSSKQNVQGELDMLVKQVIKTEGVGTEICFHAFSFGSLVALDFLFPYGNKPSNLVIKHCKGLITIGSPIEFVNVYYPRFFENRELIMSDGVNWINVYSLADALGSNFRKDTLQSEAEYSFTDGATLPINIRYEVAKVDMNVFKQFFLLYALKAHGNYWDPSKDGQSCLRLVIQAMKDKNLLNEHLLRVGLPNATESLSFTVN